jgi:hypothetical protein
MRNRIPRIESILPPSIGDKIIAGAWACKIDLVRTLDDDGRSECHASFEISGTITGQDDAKQLLQALLDRFQSPSSRKGGDRE